MPAAIVAADAIVQCDQGGLGAGGVLAAQQDHVRRFEPAEILEHVVDALRVGLRVAQLHVPAVAAVVADDERVAPDRRRGRRGTKEDGNREDCRGEDACESSVHSGRRASLCSSMRATSQPATTGGRPGAR